MIWTTSLDGLVTYLGFRQKTIYMNLVSRSLLWADSVAFVGKNSRTSHKPNVTISSARRVSSNGSAHLLSIILSPVPVVALHSCKIEIIYTRFFSIHSFFSLFSNTSPNMTFLRDVSQWVHKMIDPTPTEYKKDITYRKKKSSKVLPTLAPSTPIEVVVHTCPDTPF